jgi:hypothetical protein
MLFLYFRNRIGKIEQKVNLMFQLIQEHNTSRELEGRQRAGRAQGAAASALQSAPPHAPNEDSSHGLIEISEDEGPNNKRTSPLSADSDSSDTEPDSDSEEVSDSDEDDETNIIRIGNNDNSLGAIKTISLSLNGAEVSTNDHQVDELDELSDLEEVPTNVPVQSNVVQLLQGAEASKGDTAATNDAELTVVDKIESSIKAIIVDETPKSMDKMKVSELKDLAEARGLTNFRNLRKPKLIELLQSSS